MAKPMKKGQLDKYNMCSSVVCKVEHGNAMFFSMQWKQAHPRGREENSRQLANFGY
jgi:hypothetical protein